MELSDSEEAHSKGPLDKASPDDPLGYVGIGGFVMLMRAMETCRRSWFKPKLGPVGRGLVEYCWGDRRSLPLLRAFPHFF